MLNYSKILLNNIEQEIKGLDYIYPKADKELLHRLLEEINTYAGTNFHYLAELDAFNIPGSGKIIAKYITNFSSESVKGFLIPQMVSDKIKNCDKIILQLYLHFRMSDECVGKPSSSSPAHIYVRYDNAFKKLKPKKFAKDLLDLAHNPLDAFYLPFTMRMLASWKIPEMKEILVSYLDDNCITMLDANIDASEKQFYPSFEFIKRELKFTAIDGLKYYPSKEVADLIMPFLSNSDKDVRAAAKRTIKVINM